MKKILIPKDPDESIILPPFVDFRDPHEISKPQCRREVYEQQQNVDELSYRYEAERTAYRQLSYALKSRKQEG